MFGILFELCICYNAVFYSILCIIIKKMLKKSFPIYCGIGKKQYFCTRFPEGTPLTGAATQGAAKKKVPEKFAGMEKTPYLCRRFPSERSKKGFYEIIWIGDDEREERSILGNRNR